MKEKKIFKGKIKCSKCGEMGHRKSSYKCSFNGIKERQVIIYIEIFNCLTNAL
jgi:hypothetical protein